MNSNELLHKMIDAVLKIEPIDQSKVPEHLKRPPMDGDTRICTDCGEDFEIIRVSDLKQCMRCFVEANGGDTEAVPAILQQLERDRLAVQAFDAECKAYVIAHVLSVLSGTEVTVAQADAEPAEGQVKIGTADMGPGADDDDLLRMLATASAVGLFGGVGDGPSLNPDRFSAN